MKRCGRFCSRTPASSWLLMLGLALLLLPGAAWSSADETDPVPNAAALREKINASLEAERWDEAVEYLRAAVDADPDDARAVFMLGYTLHMQGHYDEAMEWHRRATEFEQVRPTALYNVACVQALTGQHSEALATLEQAIDAGFRHQSDIADDPDFESLRDSERFQELRTRAKRTGGNDIRRAFDFWVGTWDVLDDNGDVVGTNVISKDENGFLLTERWRSSEGGSGSSVNFFDPADGMWHQVWVDSRGSVIRFAGNVEHGAMVMNGTAVDANGKTKAVRMTFTPQDDDCVLQHFEQSLDEGKTWSTVFRGLYRQRQLQHAPSSVEENVQPCRQLLWPENDDDGGHVRTHERQTPVQQRSERQNEARRVIEIDPGINERF